MKTFICNGVWVFAGVFIIFFFFFNQQNVYYAKEKSTIRSFTTQTSCASKGPMNSGRNQCAGAFKGEAQPLTGNVFLPTHPSPKPGMADPRSGQWLFLDKKTFPAKVTTQVRVWANEHKAVRNTENFPAQLFGLCAICRFIARILEMRNIQLHILCPCGTPS